MAKDNGGQQRQEAPQRQPGPVNLSPSQGTQPQPQQSVNLPPPATSPEAAQVTVQDLLPLIAEMRAELASLRQPVAPTTQQQASSGDLLAKQVLVRRERERQLERLSEWHGQGKEGADSVRIRSQQEADRRYPDGPRRYHVELLGKAAKKDEWDRPAANSPRLAHGFPALEINANSDLEALARYQKLCGIIGLEGPEWAPIREVTRTTDAAPPAPVPDMTPPPEMMQLQLFTA